MSSTARRVGRIGGCAHPGRTGRSSSRSRAARWPRAGSTCPATARAALADAFARDTVAALAAGMPGAPVLVVTSDPDVARWVAAGGHARGPRPRRGPGRRRRRRGGVPPAAWAPRAVAVVLGDHPALRPQEVRAALAAAGAHPASVVPDADDEGTALLTLPADRPTVRTAFGAGQRRRARAARASCGSTSTCRGCASTSTTRPRWPPPCASVSGRSSGAALAHASLPGVQATIHRIEPDGSGSALLDDGVEVACRPARRSPAGCGTCASVSGSASSSTTPGGSRPGCGWSASAPARTSADPSSQLSRPVRERFTLRHAEQLRVRR